MSVGDSGQSLRPGDEVLLRYRYQDGGFQAALPMRVVSDEAGVLVAWMAPGTSIMYWALDDGRDPRTVPLEKRFEQRLTTAPRTWSGNGVLRVIPLEQHFQVLHFWDDAGSFTGWYVNLESAKSRRGARLDAVDWHLDLWISAGRVPSWKDDDEAAAAVTSGHLRVEELAMARSTGQHIIDRLDDWPTVIGDWRDFKPPDDWTKLTLDDDWRS